MNNGIRQERSGENLRRLVLLTDSWSLAGCPAVLGIKSGKIISIYWSGEREAW